MATNYGQQQAEQNLQRWQGLTGVMREPSIMASPEERAAYTAQEVRAGNVPQYELPEAYGGVPTGSTRRAFRERQAVLDQQKFMYEMARDQEARRKAQREEEIDALKYSTDSFDLDQKREKVLLEERLRNQNAANVATFQKFANQFDPNDPTAVGQLYKALGENPILANNEDVQKTVWYFDQAAQNSISSINNKIAEDVNKSINEAYSLGLSDKDLLPAMKKINVATGERYVDPVALDEIVAKQKGVGVIEEKKAKSPEASKVSSIEEENKSERGKIRSSIRDMEDSLAKELAAQAAGLKGQRLKESQAAVSVYQSQIQKRQAELEQYGGGTTTPPVQSIPTIKSQEEFNNLPSGTEYIAPNGKKYRKN